MTLILNFCYLHFWSCNLTRLHVLANSGRLAVEFTITQKPRTSSLNVLVDTYNTCRVSITSILFRPKAKNEHSFLKRRLSFHHVLSSTRQQWKNQPHSFTVSSGATLPIGHFRIPLWLCFRASLSAIPFLWKWLWFAWKWNYMQNSFSYERFHT